MTGILEAEVGLAVEAFCGGWVRGPGDGRPSGSNPMSPSSLPSPHPSGIAFDRAR